MSDKKAETGKQKEEVMRRLMIAWKSCPELRLGQLIMNAITSKDLFFAEDYDLVRFVEEYIKR